MSTVLWECSGKPEVNFGSSDFRDSVAAKTIQLEKRLDTANRCVRTSFTHGPLKGMFGVNRGGCIQRERPTGHRNRESKDAMWCKPPIPYSRDLIKKRRAHLLETGTCCDFNLRPQICTVLSVTEPGFPEERAMQLNWEYHLKDDWPRIRALGRCRWSNRA